MDHGFFDCAQNDKDGFFDSVSAFSARAPVGPCGSCRRSIRADVGIGPYSAQDDQRAANDRPYGGMT